MSETDRSCLHFSFLFFLSHSQLYPPHLFPSSSRFIIPSLSRRDVIQNVSHDKCHSLLFSISFSNPLSLFFFSLSFLSLSLSFILLLHNHDDDVDDALTFNLALKELLPPLPSLPHHSCLERSAGIEREKEDRKIDREKMKEGIREKEIGRQKFGREGKLMEKDTVHQILFMFTCFWSTWNNSVLVINDYKFLRLMNDNSCLKKKSKRSNSLRTADSLHGRKWAEGERKRAWEGLEANDQESDWGE